MLKKTESTQLKENKNRKGRRVKDKEERGQEESGWEVMKNSGNRQKEEEEEEAKRFG